MIATFETGMPKFIGIKLSGRLHDEDYKRFVPVIENTLAVEGKLRLIVRFEEFDGWDLHAAWDDFKFALKHYFDFERIAIVGDRKWEKWMASVCKPFTWAKVKYFDHSQVDVAWAWAQESDGDGEATEETDRTPDVSNNPNMWSTFL